MHTYAIGKPFSAFCEGCTNVTFPSGSIDLEGKVTLIHPSQKVENGLPIA